MGYPKVWAEKDPHKPAVIMAGVGVQPWPAGFTVTYGELDERSNRLAHYFRSMGLDIGGHVAIFAENHPRYLEACWAAERNNTSTAGRCPFTRSFAVSLALSFEPARSTSRCWSPGATSTRPGSSTRPFRASSTVSSHRPSTRAANAFVTYAGMC